MNEPVNINIYETKKLFASQILLLIVQTSWFNNNLNLTLIEINIYV